MISNTINNRLDAKRKKHKFGTGLIRSKFM